MSSKSLKPMAPNAVTMLALACGVTSIRMALWGVWSMAVVFILLSCLFDFLDGKVARMLGVSSRFGAELDSLSDFVSFGVAPGFLLYRWTMKEGAIAEFFENVSASQRLEGLGLHWVFVLFLAVCCASRLARFNSMLDVEQPPYWEHFFMGVPAPAGGLFSLMPLIAWLAFGAFGTDAAWLRTPWLVACFAVFSGVMMASKIPTFCLKHLHLGSTGRTIVWMALLALIAGLVACPWLALTVLGIGYLISIFAAVFCFMKWRREYEAQHPGETNGNA